MMMDSEEDPTTGHQGQNLHDLQNYLVTFNKEIEPGDDVLSPMDVDGAVPDLYNHGADNSMQEGGDSTVNGQLSTGFYSEQSILDSTLSDESTQQIQNLVSATEGDSDISSAIKQEVPSIDLDSVQTQISGFGDVQLSHALPDMQTGSIAQGLIMSPLNESLDPSAGKVIRIVSLGEEGQYLSMGDGQQMQILSQGDLGLGTDTLSEPSSLGVLQGRESVSLTSADPTLLQPLVTSSSAAATNLVAADDALGAIIASRANTGVASAALQKFVALQSSSDGGQTQLVSLGGTSPLTTDSLQLGSYLPSEAIGDLGYQTITIMPQELGNSDMNYVLIMAPQGEKDNPSQAVPGLHLKTVNPQYAEELVEINGEMKRVLRVTPKKLMTMMGPQLMCNYCNYTSPKRYLLTRHMKSHSEERPHRCTECDRGFKTQASLLNHVNTHTGTRPHKCKTCEAAFTTSGELVRHIRYKHTFEKPHRCPNCDYASVELSKLKRHMRSHTGERPYKCPHCPYASPDTYKLKRHLRIHTGEKPYECDICHARFTQSNSLKAHKLIHSGNKPVFQCNLCPTTCGRKTDLKIHVNKLHTVVSPLECKKCGKVFSDRYSYKQHVRSHDAERTFKCEECSFITNSERSLEFHSQIHNNGKQFQCDLCQTTFNFKAVLDKHRSMCQGGATADTSFSSLIDDSKDRDSDDDHLLARPPVPKGPPTSGYKAPTPTSAPTLNHPGGASTPATSDTLHRNLLQDIRAGKLGDVPQVVIVHPDGSLEEISSKLPGAKLNLSDILSTLSNSEKSEQSKTSAKEQQPSSSSSPSPRPKETKTSKTKTALHIEKVEQSTVDDDAVAGKREQDDTSEILYMQCEAGTQVELESDTDSAGDDSCSEESPAGAQESNSSEPSVNQPNPIEDDCGPSQAFPKEGKNGDPPELSIVTSDLQPVPTAANQSPTSQLTVSTSADTSLDHTTSELIKSSPKHGESENTTAQTSSLSPDSNSSSAAAASKANCANPQFALIKGYTYVGEGASQPTFVNLAMDRDSVIKLFMSLNQQVEGQSSSSPTAGAVQLLPADLDSAIVMGGESGADLSMFPMIQLGDLSGLILNQDPSLEVHSDEKPISLEHQNLTDDSGEGKDSESLNHSGNSETSESRLEEHTDAESVHRPGEEEDYESLTPISKCATSVKMSLSTKNQFNNSISFAAVSAPSQSTTSSICDIKTSPSSLVDLDPGESNGEDKLVLSSDSLLDSSAQEEGTNKVEPQGSQGKTVDDTKRPSPKRSNRKRSTATADPGLLVTGKRVRKALVKVSL